MVRMLSTTSYLRAFVLTVQSRAGAHWRTHAKKDDIEQQAWDLETYAAWMKVVKEEEAREAQGEVLRDGENSGIAVCPHSLHRRSIATTIIPRPTPLTSPDPIQHNNLVHPIPPRTAALWHSHLPLVVKTRP
jgi:hypothetical protein